MSEAGSSFYLIHQNGKPVGYLKINDANPLDGYLAADCMEVERLYLLATVTGSGIGKAAMGFAGTLARKQGRNVLWLKTMDSSPAVHFYEKIGFRRCGQTYLAFSLMKEEFRNMFVMKKELV
jgi:GNAT superfamily N-acetyltransferase